MKRPENLYELCEQVCEAIAMSPMNYNQGNWASSTARVFKNRRGREPEAGEACGTSFCRAGWMCALLDKQKTTVDWAHDFGIADRAEGMLRKAGIPEGDITNLFSGSACSGRWATKEYVQSGIDGMKAFMAKHEEKLKAAAVPPEKP